MRFAIEVNAMRLRFSPVEGRRTLHASITIGPWRLWVQRWDTARSTGYRTFALSRDRLMAWTAGVAR